MTSLDPKTDLFLESSDIRKSCWFDLNSVVGKATTNFTPGAWFVVLFFLFNSRELNQGNSGSFVGLRNGIDQTSAPGLSLFEGLGFSGLTADGD